MSRILGRLLRSPWRRLTAGFALFLVGVGQCMEPAAGGAVAGSVFMFAGLLLAVDNGLELTRGFR